MYFSVIILGVCYCNLLQFEPKIYKLLQDPLCGLDNNLSNCNYVWAHNDYPLDQSPLVQMNTTLGCFLNKCSNIFRVSAISRTGASNHFKNGNKLSTLSYNFDENNKGGCYFISRHIFTNLNKTGYIQSERLGACSIKPFLW